MRALRVRPQLVHVVRALYAGASVRTSWGGRALDNALLVRVVRQGFSRSRVLSGPLACHASVRTIVSAVPTSRGHLLSLRGHVGVPVLRNMEVAAGLWLNARKSQLIDSSGAHVDYVKDESRLFAFFADVEVVRGRYLGVRLGPDAAGQVWTSAVAEFRARVRHISGMPIHLQQRVRAYATFAFSVLRFLVQVIAPTQAVLRAEQAAVASMTRSAMHPLGPWLPPRPVDDVRLVSAGPMPRSRPRPRSCERPHRTTRSSVRD